MWSRCHHVTTCHLVSPVTPRLRFGGHVTNVTFPFREGDMVTSDGDMQ